MSQMILKYETEIYTIVLFFLLIITRLILKKIINRFSVVRSIDPNRKKIIFSFCYLALYMLTGFFLAIIWGVEMKQLIVFGSSILAVLGIALFAEWSILSNLTASVILFFSNPVRIGDKIRILDKDFDWTGEVIDISGFYFFLKTDAGENIILPNALVIQKGIQIMDREL